MRIALAQINTKLGDVPANLKKHLEMISQARRQEADLVVFPELSLTGYILQDLSSTVACRPTPEDPTFAPLLAASKNIDIVVGFVEEDRRSRYYIAAAYLSRGEVVHIHRKVYLPTYGLFDEGRFFAAGDQIRAFDTRFGRMGILICEDFWHASPPYLLWLDGADLMLFISASPSRGLTESPKLESSRWVEHINRAYASLFTSFIAAVNRVGYEDGINYWGGSTLHGPDGEIIANAPYQDEGLTVAEVDFSALQHVRSRLPLLRDERPDLTLRELNRILEK
ncbi:carbon-nitrogen hydrolase [bacterium]|nr:carbon-nitrogen hydrolase [bacterium]MCB2179157.1 carbon-nitrogen hydrolase [bacterium]